MNICQHLKHLVNAIYMTFTQIGVFMDFRISTSLPDRHLGTQYQSIFYSQDLSNIMDKELVRAKVCCV